MPRIFGTCLIALLALAGAAAAQPPLRWGADKAGGAPYVFDEASGTVGFEVELAEYLGRAIGRTPVMVQGQWDNLPDALSTGDIDICLNGFEFLPEREKEFPSTIPYYVYTLRLVARKGDDSIKDWDDLRGRDGRPKKRVGVLRGSAADRYLREAFGDDIELVAANEVDEMYQLVEAGEQLDATVQDSPSVMYFVKSGRLSKLRVVGEPREKGYYVILTRAGDGELREQLNAAIRKAAADGTLKRVYQKYNLWEPAEAEKQQAELKEVQEKPWPPADAKSKSSLTLAGLSSKLLKAAWKTVLLAVCAMPLAILLGIFIAIGRVYGGPLVRAPLSFYVEVMRGTPVLLQLFVLFYLIRPLLGATGWPPLVWAATLPPEVYGILGLALNYAAYEAEIYRAGILAIPRGQTEAALALGMTPAAAVRRVVLPQAVRLVIPPVTNDFIALFKDTSICSMILITELTGLYYQYKWDRGLALELGLTVALIYLFLSYPLSLLARWLERRQGGHR